VCVCVSGVRDDDDEAADGRALSVLCPWQCNVPQTEQSASVLSPDAAGVSRTM